MMHQIFRGLDLSQDEARELAIYWKAAGNDAGLVNSEGHLLTSNGKWKRPMARKCYTMFKVVLDRNPYAKGFVPGENFIFIDFEKLEYNINEVQRLIRENGLGVQDSKEGLILYKKNETPFTGVWYESIMWPLKGITTGMLPKGTKTVVSISPGKNSPEHAEWAQIILIP